MANVVLGHFPGYVTLAGKLSVAYFNVGPGIWRRLSPPQRDLLNSLFLRLRLGDQFVFSHDPILARPNSAFEREVQFLKSIGFNLRAITVAYVA